MILPICYNALMQQPDSTDQPKINTGEIVNNPEVAPELLERARALFEVDRVENLDSASTFPGYIYQVFREIHSRGDTGQVATLASAIKYVKSMVEQSIRRAGEKGLAGSPLEDKWVAKALNAEVLKSLEVVITELLGKTRQLEAYDEDRMSATIEERRLLQEEVADLNRSQDSLDDKELLMAILSAAGGSARRHMQEVYRMRTDGKWTPGSRASDTTREYLYDRLSRNPSGARYELLRQLKPMVSGDFDALISIENQETHDDEGITTLDGEAVRAAMEIDGVQELDFEILPSDTNLRELSEQIFNESSDIEKVKVDLGRIQILEDIRQIFGKDKCYFARGQQRGKVYHTKDGDSINEDFIILVMQNHDANGAVASEDALAISPISRRHAAFYTREAASAGTWRELLGLSKLQAREYGTRRLKFTAPEGVDIYEAMREKIFALATCPASDFHEEMRYDVATESYKVRSVRTRLALSRAASQLAS